MASKHLSLTYAYLKGVNRSLQFEAFYYQNIELPKTKLRGMSPPGGFVSPSGGFSLLLIDQAVPKSSKCHLADQKAICILH